MLVVVLGILFLMLIGVGLYYHITYIISIINNPLITLTLFDYLVWFITCALIVLVILDIIIIKDELDYII